MKKLKISKFNFNLYISGQFIGLFDSEQDAKNYAKAKYPYLAPILVPVETLTYREESE